MQNSVMANQPIYLVLVVLLSPFLFDTILPWGQVVNGEQLSNADCVALKTLISNRFSRCKLPGIVEWLVIETVPFYAHSAAPRMLRKDGVNEMGDLIRLHHNCLLQSDKIRFKKSSSSPSVQNEDASSSMIQIGAPLVDLKAIKPNKPINLDNVYVNPMKPNRIWALFTVQPVESVTSDY